MVLSFSFRKLIYGWTISPTLYWIWNRTYLLLDNWHLEGPLLLNYGPWIINNSVCFVNAKVSRALSTGNWSWQPTRYAIKFRIQDRYAEVNIEQNAEDKVKNLGISNLGQQGMLLKLLYRNLSGVKIIYINLLKFLVKLTQKTQLFLV